MSAGRPTRPLSLTSSGALSVGFVIMWSSGWIGGRLGTSTVSTITLMLWRFALVGAALALVLWVIRRWRRAAPILGRREIAVHGVIGLLAQGLYSLGNIGAIEAGVGAGTAALITALQPLTAGALAGPVLGETVNRRQWLGLGVGLVGVVLVVGGDATGVDAAPWWAYTLPLLGMSTLVAATFVERRSPTAAATPLLHALGIQSAASAGLLALLAVATGHLLPPAAHVGDFAITVAWFIGFCTFGAYGFYWMTLRRTSVTHVSSLIYLTPPTTMLWAWLMFGDPIAPRALIGLAVCAAGVALATRSRPSPEPPTASPSGSVATGPPAALGPRHHDPAHVTSTTIGGRQ